MKASYVLVVAAIWIALAIALRTGLVTGIHVHFHKGMVNPDIAWAILRFVPSLIFFGWIVPTALGLWLLWARK